MNRLCTVLILAILMVIFFFTTGVAAVSPSNPSFSLLDAREKGVFNIGLALGGVARSFDKDIKKNVLKFDYSLPQGSIIGVWTKDYPSEIRKNVVDAVRIGVKVPDPNQLRQVSVTLEIKGIKAMQRVPLQLEAGWNYFREVIDWNMIGDLREVVFVVNPMSVGPQGANPMWFNPTEGGSAAGSKPMDGILYFDMDFYKLTFLQKNFIFAKVALIFLLSLLTAFMVKLIGGFFGRRDTSGGSDSIRT